MEGETHIAPISNFTFEGTDQNVSYSETTPVTNGVTCDVYTFDGDSSKDLGVIRIKPGSKTPLQRVVQGERTVEGFISGKGQLTITKSDGKQEVFKVGE